MMSYISAQYGDPLPDIGMFADSDVMILDFSYKREETLAIAKVARSLVVLDHHKTAEKELEGIPGCHFDMSRSGARMTYDHLKALGALGIECLGIEWLVDYVQDRDLWQWKLPRSREVSAAIASYPFDFGTWMRFELEDLISEGTAILRYQSQLVERICTKAIPMAIDGLPAGMMAVNSPILQSEIGESLCRFANWADIWYQDKDGSVIHSLRSTSVDVSEIASRFGGGGHPCAAGYRVDVGRDK